MSMTDNVRKAMVEAMKAKAHQDIQHLISQESVYP